MTPEYCERETHGTKPSSEWRTTMANVTDEIEASGEK